MGLHFIKRVVHEFISHNTSVASPFAFIVIRPTGKRFLFPSGVVNYPDRLLCCLLPFFVSGTTCYNAFYSRSIVATKEFWDVGCLA